MRLCQMWFLLRVSPEESDTAGGCGNSKLPLHIWAGTRKLGFFLFLTSAKQPAGNQRGGEAESHAGIPVKSHEWTINSH